MLTRRYFKIVCYVIEDEILKGRKTMSGLKSRTLKNDESRLEKKWTHSYEDNPKIVMSIPAVPNLGYAKFSLV